MFTGINWRKSYKYIIILLGIMLVAITLIMYIMGYAFGLSLPFMNKINTPNRSEVNTIIGQWKNVKLYKKTVPKVSTESIRHAKTEDKTEEDFYKTFKEIDRSSLSEYITSNKDVVKGGYGKLFIDKVDSGNTGIKTIKGDEVIAIDVKDNIAIVGIALNGNKGKMAIIKDKSQIGLGVTQDLAYWEDIKSLADSEKAIFAVNASNYTYNDMTNYGTVNGLLKRNGNIINKSKNKGNTLGFSHDGSLKLGNIDISNMYNAFECDSILSLNGKEKKVKDTTKCARVAVGENGDGTLYILQIDGGVQGSDVGVTEGDMVSTLKKYGAKTIAGLSSGNRVIVYWNGRVVNKTYGYRQDGLLLPSALIVHKK